MEMKCDLRGRRAAFNFASNLLSRISKSNTTKKSGPCFARLRQR